ncbi:gliding motility lipoprotein GldH [Niabella ginsenosidivorans]|uniref:Gliding motility lipoprotein GldH n=1 Tax=Niabella ginsenosidivorans TaxID=1176587 RepID=A0A1A9I966_9BACT|nr:gliding motility lipoprotein GldH [Niabella ginsenosidivorans]ANH83609.1 gliding motility lipoprotein GldH [Niabella ginsenosidivorans]
MNRLILFISLMLICWLASCKQVDVNQRVADIPDHKWGKRLSAIIDLDVKDTADYGLYFIFRHTEQYPYNNIIAKITVKDTANHTIAAFTVNASLVSASGKWDGRGIDDLYDHFIKLNRTIPLKKNRYRFVISQLMKDDPLPFVLNAGIGIEKATGQ